MGIDLIVNQPILASMATPIPSPLDGSKELETVLKSYSLNDVERRPLEVFVRRPTGAEVWQIGVENLAKNNFAAASVAVAKTHRDN